MCGFRSDVAPSAFCFEVVCHQRKLVHSFSKWFQSINSFLHVVGFSCQVFDGVTERNTLFSKGTGGTSFIQHILTSRAGCGFFNLQGMTFLHWKHYKVAVATAVSPDREVLFGVEV